MSRWPASPHCLVYGVVPKLSSSLDMDRFLTEISYVSVSKKIIRIGLLLCHTPHVNFCNMSTTKNQAVILVSQIRVQQVLQIICPLFPPLPS